MARWRNILKFMAEDFSFLDDHNVEFSVIRIDYRSENHEMTFNVYYRINGTTYGGKQEVKSIVRNVDNALFRRYKKQLIELNETNSNSTYQCGKDNNNDYVAVYVNWDSLNNLGRVSYYTFTGEEEFSAPEVRELRQYRSNEISCFLVMYNTTYDSGLYNGIRFLLFKIEPSMPDELINAFFKNFKKIEESYLAIKKEYDEFSKLFSPEVKLLHATGNYK